MGVCCETREAAFHRRVQRGGREIGGTRMMAVSGSGNGEELFQVTCHM